MSKRFGGDCLCHDCESNGDKLCPMEVRRDDLIAALGRAKSAEADNARLRAEVEALKPKWTSEIPREPGTYVLWHPDWNPGRMEVKFYRDPVGALAGLGYWVYGPLPEPEEK